MTLHRFFGAKGFFKSAVLLIGIKWLSVTIVVFSFAKLLQNAPLNFDIWLYGETVYLSDGLRSNTANESSQNLFADYEKGGLYAAYYRTLFLFIKDPVKLYLWGGNIIILSALLIAFGCLAVLSRSLIYATLGIGVFLLSPMPYVWPRTSFAAIVTLGISLMIASAVERASSCFAILTVGAFLTCFIRPEFSLAFYGMGFACAAAFFHEHWHKGESRTSNDVIVLASFGAVLMLSMLWSFPFLSGGHRAFIAFGQLFAFRMVEANKLAIDPWVNWETIVAKYFPTSHSVMAAIRENPLAFTKHVLANGLDIIKTVVQQYIRPLLIMAFYLIGLGMGWGFQAVDKPDARATWPLLLGTTIFIVPVLFGSLVEMPRDHYILIIIFLLLCSLALCIARCPQFDQPLVLVIAAVTFFFSTPVMPVTPQPTLEVVRRLQAAPKTHVMLEIDGGWCTYLPSRCQTVWAFDLPSDKSVEAFFNEKRIDSIVVSRRLLAYTRVASDPYFQLLLKDPHRFGWETIQLSSEYYFLFFSPQ